MGVMSSICSCISAYLVWSDGPSVKQVYRVFKEIQFDKSKEKMFFNSIIEEITKKAFVRAIDENNTNNVLKLIKEGFPINSFINEEKFTALHYASKRGSLKIMKILIEKSNADINLQDDIEKWTPLMICSINGHYECVEYLIKQKANKNLISETNLKAIDYANEGKNSSIKDKEKKNFEKIVNLLEKEENN